MKRTPQQFVDHHTSRRTVLKAFGLGSGAVMLSAAGFADDALHSVPQQALQGVYTIQQQSNGRFVDAHELAAEDFRLVTRPAQNNTTQRWILTQVGAAGSVYTIQQQSNGRFVDAHELAAEDFRLVTRPAQNNTTQRWILTLV
jgi:hypothetical protein